MKRLLPLLLVALVVGACAPVKITGPSACPIPSAQEMVAAVNADRAAHNLAPMTLDPQLVAHAHAWAQYMASVGTLHHSPDSYRNPRSTPKPEIGENIAGPLTYCATAATVEAGWMASPGHKDRILDPNDNRFGGAFVLDAQGRWWAVQHFIHRTPGWPTF